MQLKSDFTHALGITLVLAALSNVAFSFLTPPAAQAQDVTAAVRGTVADEQGATIAGAEVTVRSPGTAFVRTATTGSDGVYNFPDLPLGSYTIRVSHAGFKTGEQTGIVLHVADSRVIDFALHVGQISEQVTVQASALQVETTSGGLSGLVEGNQVATLPLNGRNFMQLVTLVPGVAAGPQFSAQAKGLKGGSAPYWSSPQ